MRQQLELETESNDYFLSTLTPSDDFAKVAYNPKQIVVVESNILSRSSYCH